MESPMSRLSFGAEIECAVAHLPSWREDPHASHAGLPPLLRIDETDERASDEVLQSIRNTLKEHGIGVYEPPTLGAMPSSLVDDPAAKLPRRLRHADKWHVGMDYTVEVDPPLRALYNWQDVEIRTPAFRAGGDGDEARAEIAYVLDLLRARYRLHLNTSTGFHVHVGNGADWFPAAHLRRLGALVWVADPLLSRLHPPWRRVGEYSNSIRYSSALACGGVRTEGANAMAAAAVARGPDTHLNRSSNNAGGNGDRHDAPGESRGSGDDAGLNGSEAAPEEAEEEEHTFELADEQREWLLTHLPNLETRALFVNRCIELYGNPDVLLLSGDELYQVLLACAPGIEDGQEIPPWSDILRNWWPDWEPAPASEDGEQAGEDHTEENQAIEVTDEQGMWLLTYLPDVETRALFVSHCIDIFGHHDVPQLSVDELYQVLLACAPGIEDGQEIPPWSDILRNWWGPDWASADSLQHPRPLNPRKLDASGTIDRFEGILARVRQRQRGGEDGATTEHVEGSAHEEGPLGADGEVMQALLRVLDNAANSPDVDPLDETALDYKGVVDRFGDRIGPDFWEEARRLSRNRHGDGESPSQKEDGDSSDGPPASLLIGRGNDQDSSALSHVTSTQSWESGVTSGEYNPAAFDALMGLYETPAASPESSERPVPEVSAAVRRMILSTSSPADARSRGGSQTSAQAPSPGDGRGKSPPLPPQPDSSAHSFAATPDSKQSTDDSVDSNGGFDPPGTRALDNFFGAIGPQGNTGTNNNNDNTLVRHPNALRSNPVSHASHHGHATAAIGAGGTKLRPHDVSQLTESYIADPVRQGSNWARIGWVPTVADPSDPGADHAPGDSKACNAQCADHPCVTARDGAAEILGCGYAGAVGALLGPARSGRLNYNFRNYVPEHYNFDYDYDYDGAEAGDDDGGDMGDDDEHDDDNIRTVEFREAAGSLDGGGWVRVWTEICVGVADWCLKAPAVDYLELLDRVAAQEDRDQSGVEQTDDERYDVCDLLDDMCLFAQAEWVRQRERREGPPM
ncbi:hypothetical protein DL766_001267 [Monosporascus sp. MC13-8B]|uniref:Amidoligase enzyme n=1 Tax=Monosporascus cannonballus TaxID=155416 RepID=A0ABY0H9W0_9PEZI|nr:hypothetical protein DL762_003674 [Monosporascus cannonballus]RYO96979.1 hypothetical protein DL763_003016 [Monosporascus cannonballus]RYP37970.1 hypothetical protein DL766_001267 [Monosporascus sp. MC13-8B]